MSNDHNQRYRQIELLCSIDIEQTPYSLHAHAIPENVEIGPGDTIIVHDAPTNIAFGETYTGERRATLYRASTAQRIWTQFTSMFDIGELYEVGFNPVAEAACFSSLKV
ncbi:MAG: hypothetical protein B7Z75_08250 [Acidocella sp. 20-57-95]|nr:MAG: hypothetical protein B7Z75_08250 [Acidocella sp. 20-57-95]HQT64848.1 hypothetical protein [Acidocella sp.]HQU05324.1 hypothetical protein [Acidocella sp.]